MTKDEAAVISRTVSAVSDFSQVFVVDSQSSDDTKRLAAQAGGTVVDFVWNGQYPKKKQWCLENLPFDNDWVLFLDADELPTKRLCAEVSQAVRGTGSFNAYEARLDYHFDGKKLRFGHRVWKRVLLNRHHCSFPVFDDLDVQTMWEVEGHYQPECHGAVGKFAASLDHDDIDPVYDFFARHNRYSDWEAHVAEGAGRAQSEMTTRPRLSSLAKRLPARGLAFFLYAYVARLGFCDGRPGLNYALALSFYHWQISLKRREIRRSRRRPGLADHP